MPIYVLASEGALIAESLKCKYRGQHLKDTYVCTRESNLQLKPVHRCSKNGTCCLGDTLEHTNCLKCTDRNTGTKAVPNKPELIQLARNCVHMGSKIRDVEVHS